MTEDRLKEIKYLMDINQVNPTIVKELLSEVLKYRMFIRRMREDNLRILEEADIFSYDD